MPSSVYTDMARLGAAAPRLAPRVAADLGPICIRLTAAIAIGSAPAAPEFSVG